MCEGELAGPDRRPLPGYVQVSGRAGRSGGRGALQRARVVSPDHEPVVALQRQGLKHDREPLALLMREGRPDVEAEIRLPRPFDHGVDAIRAVGPIAEVFPTCCAQVETFRV